MPRALLLIFITTVLGCTQKHAFDVSVRNDTSRPLTVGFVKSGGPLEPDWASPEDLTELPPSGRPTDWGEVLPPGKSASVRVGGDFESGAAAFLRVYAGAYPLRELLAISRDTGDRLDLALAPERRNAYVIHEDLKGRIFAKQASLDRDH